MICGMCGQRWHVDCPSCGRRVALVDGKVVAHERSMVLGSHVEWSSCKSSGKTLVAPAPHKGEG